MEQIGFEASQVSMTVDDDEVVLPSESEAESSSSSSSSSALEQFKDFKKRGMLVRLQEGSSTEFEIIEKTFRGGAGPCAGHVAVAAVHKNLYSDLMGQARMETFRVYSAAVGKKCGGDANIRYAWYGASRDEIGRIISHGFTCSKKPENNGHQGYGVGIQLSPANFSIGSIESAVEDENGTRHMLLCRVILGNMEVVSAGSEQSSPSAEHFDSGVDNPLEPRRYIIWSAYMNSFIFPNYIISFKLPSSSLLQEGVGIQEFPRSPHMKIPALLSVLSNHLHPSKVALISKYHNDFLVRKITREELVRRLRQIAGDHLLRSVIKMCKKPSDLRGQKRLRTM